MQEQYRTRYIPDGPSTPQTKPSRSPTETPPSVKQYKRFSFVIPPFRRRRSDSPPTLAASETTIARPGGTSGRGWTFPLRLKSRKGREEQQQRESSREVVGGLKDRQQLAEVERKEMSEATGQDSAVVQHQEPYPSPSSYHHQGEVIGGRRNEPLLPSLHTPFLRPPAHLGPSPPSPRHEFPFPVIHPISHSPPHPTRFSPTSSTATTPRLLPRLQPPALQATSNPLPPADSLLPHFPSRQHLQDSNSPSMSHQALALHPLQHFQSRFTETLPRPLPLSLPAPSHLRSPSPFRLQRAPSTDSSISPSIELPAYYEFPHHQRGRPREQPISRFSDWTSTSDSIDSPWDEPFSCTDGSWGGGASRRASLATGGSSVRDRSRRYSAPEIVGESDGDADGEENGEETDEQENVWEIRERLRHRKSHSHDGSSRLPSRHRTAEVKPRMVSTSTQTTEDLLIFYDSHSAAPPPSEPAPSSSSSQQPHRRAPPPPPSPSSQLLHEATSSNDVVYPPAHSDSSSSAATWCSSTADTSMQGVEIAEGMKPPLLSPVKESGSRRSSSVAGLNAGDKNVRKRVSALAEWKGTTKAQKDARRRTVG